MGRGLDAWAKQHAEWCKIGDELIDKLAPNRPSAWDITQEQMARCEARGEHFLNYTDIVDMEGEAIIEEEQTDIFREVFSTLDGRPVGELVPSTRGVSTVSLPLPPRVPSLVDYTIGEIRASKSDPHRFASQVTLDGDHFEGGQEIHVELDVLLQKPADHIILRDPLEDFALVVDPKKE